MMQTLTFPKINTLLSGKWAAGKNSPYLSTVVSIFVRTAVPVLLYNWHSMTDQHVKLDDISPVNATAVFHSD